MVSVEQFKRGVDLFFTGEVFPKLPDKKRFLAAFGVALLVGTIDTNPAVVSLGLVPEAGVLDLERAYAAAKSASNVAPLVLDVPVVGTMKFVSSDIDRLYQTILNA